MTPKRHTVRWAAAVLAVVGIGVAVATSKGGGHAVHHPTVAAATVDPPVTTASPPVTTVAAAPALGTATHDWFFAYSSELLAASTEIDDNMNAVLADANASDLSAVVSDCTTGKTAVRVIELGTASTDPRAPYQWQDMLDAATEMFDACASLDTTRIGPASVRVQSATKTMSALIEANTY